MQALILAAGVGSRLQPLTDTVPKAMVPVNGKPLLVKALENLSANNIRDAVIVVGYKKEVIMGALGSTCNGVNITYVENPEYRTTNNVYSMFLARHYIHDDTILLECDLFYEQNLIAAILKGDADCNILVSPFNKDTMDGTVIDVTDGDAAKALIVKRDQTPGFDYSNKFKTVNVYTFSKDFITNRFFPAIELYIQTQSKNSYYELVLGSLIYFHNQSSKVVHIAESEWCEIDDQKDLKRAEEKFTGNGQRKL